jgi:hypothetical protein
MLHSRETEKCVFVSHCTEIPRSKVDQLGCAMAVVALSVIKEPREKNAASCSKNGRTTMVRFREPFLKKKNG